jgi:hypothetical protein
MKGERNLMEYVYCIFKHDNLLLKICASAEIAIDTRDKLCKEEGYSDEHLFIRKKELIK